MSGLWGLETYIASWYSGTVVASQEEGPRAFPLLLAFSLISKDMHVKLTRYSKMAIVMNVSASKSVKQ